MRKSFLPFVILSLANFTFFCTDNAERGEGLLFGSGAQLNPCFDSGGICPHYQFIGDVDNELTPSCGTATSTATTTTTTFTSRQDTSDSYGIVSSLFFKNGIGPLSYNGAAMSLKYKYYANRDSYSMSPLELCVTTDFSTCSTDSTSGALIGLSFVDTVSSTGARYYACAKTLTTITGTTTTTTTATCDTTNLFIYTATIPGFGETTDPTTGQTTPNPSTTINFYGVRGTLNWENGFSLSSDNSTVSTAKLKFDMIGADLKTLFKGEINCKSDN